jgi:hypothetical protein
MSNNSGEGGYYFKDGFRGRENQEGVRYIFQYRAIEQLIL